MEQTKNDEYKKVKSNIIKNSIPTIIAFILSDVFTMIDTMLIGSISDETVYTASLSAINVTARVMLFISLPLVIISLIFMKKIMIFIGNDPIIYDVGKGYYIAIMIGFIFSSFNNIFAFLSRSVCEAKRTLYMESFANIFNILGDVVLINGLFIFPKLGVTGAGIATLIYKIILTIMWLFVLFKSKSRLRIDKSYKFKFNKRMIKDILHVGVPSSTELLSIRGANIIFTKIIAKYTILTDVLLKVILAYIFVNILKFDLVSVWIIIALQECLKAVIFYKRFHSESWKNIKVINDLDEGE